MPYALAVQSLHLPGALIGLGFVGVLAWTAAFLTANRPTDAETWVYWIATTAGYGLAGFACWRWIVGARQAPADEAVAGGPSRWMAAASVVTAAGVAALTYWTYHVHSALIHVGDGSDPRYGLRPAGDAVGTVGFLLAAAGFWIASTARPPDA